MNSFTLEETLPSMTVKYTEVMNADLCRLKKEREVTFARVDWQQAIVLVNAALKEGLNLHVALTEEGEDEIPSCVINVIREETTYEYRIIHNGKIDFTLLPKEDRCHSRLIGLCNHIMDADHPPFVGAEEERS